MEIIITPPFANFLLHVSVALLSICVVPVRCRQYCISTSLSFQLKTFPNPSQSGAALRSTRAQPSIPYRDCVTFLEMGKNSKGGIKARKSFHEADLKMEREQEEKRKAKLARKQDKVVREAEAAFTTTTSHSTSRMELEPRVPPPKKQKIGGVRKKSLGGVRKPPRMMRKTLKKLAKKRAMDI